MSKSPRSNRYIPTLDGWRAIAVLGVIAFHLRGEAQRHIPASLVASHLGLGRFGVDLFFAISGFLITTRLVEERDASGSVRIGAFYVRRVFRILPPAFSYLALVGAMALLRTWRPTNIEWLGSVFFFRNYIDGSRLTEHLWSLSVEEHFYAVWPVLFLFCARSRRAAWIAAAFAVAITAWRSLVTHGVVSLAIPGTPWFRTDLRFDALMWGAALALALRGDTARAFARRIFARPMAVAAVVVFYVVGTTTLFAFDAGATLLALAAPALIASTVLHPQWFVSRLLENAALRWIGRLSYSLYLFQQAFIAAPIQVPHPYWLFLPAALGSYYLVERPMIALGADLLARRSPPPKRARRAFGVAFAAIVLPIVVYVGWPRDLTLRGKRAMLYTDAGYCGAAKELGPGRYDLTAPGSAGNDAISSLRVGTEARVRLCEHVSHGAPGGQCVEFGPGTNVDGLGEFNDRASFVEVTAVGR